MKANCLEVSVFSTQKCHLIFFYLCVDIQGTEGEAHMSEGACEGQKRKTDPQNTVPGDCKLPNPSARD